MSKEETSAHGNLYAHIGSHDWFYNKIECEFSVKEMHMVRYMLAYAAGAMAQDKSIAQYQTEMAAALVHKVRANVVRRSNRPTTMHLEAMVSFAEYNNLTDEQKSLYVPLNNAAPRESVAVEVLQNDMDQFEQKANRISDAVIQCVGRNADTVEQVNPMILRVVHDLVEVVTDSEVAASVVRYVQIGTWRKK